MKLYIGKPRYTDTVSSQMLLPGTGKLAILPCLELTIMSETDTVYKPVALSLTWLWACWTVFVCVFKGEARGDT